MFQLTKVSDDEEHTQLASMVEIALARIKLCLRNSNR